jgi:mannose-6-phosphate isomerase-like protein (cupin superfamily)
LVSAKIVKEADGIPVLYPDCVRGFGIRVVHPQNPKAESKNLSMQLLYIAPGGVLFPHSHVNEEIYYILEGKGRGEFGLTKTVDIEKGMFIHLPSNAIHGLENTGETVMKVLISTSPPYGALAEWKATVTRVAHQK